MSRKKILEKIKQHKRFIVAAHINPEGDSIGSQLAMATLLKKMGKTVRIVNADPVPKNLMFLPGADQVETFSEKFSADDFDAAVVLDCPVLERIGKVKSLLPGKYTIVIDHHISAEKFGDMNWVEPQASSAGEMVYALFREARIALDNASALCLYTAVMTDTGSFRFSNTTVDTHKITAELLRYDINAPKVYEWIYGTKSFKTLKMLAEVLSNLETSPDGKFVWFKITHDMLKRYELGPESADDFIDYARMVEGAEVIACLREIPGGSGVKVSLRAKGGADVNRIAGYFGGGGHVAASGCVIKGEMDEAEKLLREQVKKYFER